MARAGREWGDMFLWGILWIGGIIRLRLLRCFFLLKARYPQNITLLRGNHESRSITQVYGFYDECLTKFGSASVWKAFCNAFDYLNLAAIVDGSILCVHGGLSPDVKSVEQVRCLARVMEIPHEGAFCDLMWSDPEEIDGWAVSPRGAGWLFGARVTREFLHLNDLSLLARAHQLVQEGYKHMFASPSSASFTSSLSSAAQGHGQFQTQTQTQDGLVTVWSAPNYCYRCGNLGSVMRLGYSDPPPFASSSSSDNASTASLPSSLSTSFTTTDDQDEDDDSGGQKDNPTSKKSTHFLASAGTVGPTGIRKDFIVFDAAPENETDKEQRVGRAGVMTMQYFV